MNSSLLTGLIAGVFTLSGIILKDVIGRKNAEKRAAERDTLALYRVYANPLTNAAQDLFWRLYEILRCGGRGVFLHSKAPETNFNSYKRISTLYRLAAMLAWIRAYKREISYLPVNDSKKLSELQGVINQFSDALASGLHIEKERVLLLSEIWEYDLPDDQILLEQIYIEIETCLREELHKANSNNANEMDYTLQSDLCRKIADTLSEITNHEKLSDEKLLMKQETAIKILSIKEAWIYRDYQSGIGDFMLSDSSNSSRRFDVAGFGEFEAIYNRQSDDASQLWISRLERVFTGLNINGNSRYDARIGQLERVMKTTAKLILILTSIDPRSKAVITKETQVAISEVIQNGE